MIGWHAVVPIKPAAARKPRLQGCLSREEIEELTEAMLRHVLDVVGSVGAIDTVMLLASERPAGWSGDWFRDPGLGLNEALNEMGQSHPHRTVVLHADLPALEGADVAALVAAAEGGGAIAPDHRGFGTNAIAVPDARTLQFSFGPDSFARHRAQMPSASIVRRPGLALDIDLPEDVPLARRCLGNFYGRAQR